MSLSKFTGMVTIVVNVASQCGCALLMSWNCRPCITHLLQAPEHTSTFEVPQLVVHVRHPMRRYTTSNYEGLVRLYDQYKDRGFDVVSVKARIDVGIAETCHAICIRLPSSPIQC